MVDTEYRTKAKPRAMAGDIPVFCAFDKIVKIQELKPNPQNPNQHPTAQIKLLAEIIKATGWREPITVSKNSGLIVKGHGRLLAAQLANMTEVPVDFQEYSSNEEETADLLADNRIAEFSDLDKKALLDCFENYDSGEVPFILSGFTEDEYKDLASMFDEMPKEKKEKVKCECSEKCPYYGQEGCEKK